MSSETLSPLGRLTLMGLIVFIWKDIGEKIWDTVSNSKIIIPEFEFCRFEIVLVFTLPSGLEDVTNRRQKESIWLTWDVLVELWEEILGIKDINAWYCCKNLDPQR